ncbi:MAG TPA: adenosylhomocysteinase, partial [Microbacterium sp.]|nr:adenosylhomocysteinase [Microbacterium sp.]
PDAAPGDSAEYRVVLDVLRRSLARDPERFTRMSQELVGVTEETTTGVHRLYELARDGELLFPAINV